MSIESPCTLVCSIDPVTGYCFGCGRTGEEISMWIAYSPEARRDVMARLPERMTRLRRPERRRTRRSMLAERHSRAEPVGDA